MSSDDGGGRLQEYSPATSDIPHVSKENTGFQPGTVRILVADDHEVMRMGIRNLLESVPSWSVYTEAKTGREAVDAALASSPDIIIMDITMPEMNGLEAAAKIAAERPDIPVIMFSLHLSEDVITRFKSGSIRGAVAKSEAARDLLEAVKCVLAGGTFFPDKHARLAAEPD
jgi:two-component system nitrate/nitrite response regulator NarL